MGSLALFVQEGLKHFRHECLITLTCPKLPVSAHDLSGLEDLPNYAYSHSMSRPSSTGSPGGSAKPASDSKNTEGPRPNWNTLLQDRRMRLLCVSGLYFAEIFTSLRSGKYSLTTSLRITFARSKPTTRSTRQGA